MNIEFIQDPSSLDMQKVKYIINQTKLDNLENHRI